MSIKKCAVIVASSMLWASASYAATATVSVGFGVPTAPSGTTAAVVNSPSNIAVSTGDATTAAPLQPTQETKVPSTSFSANVFFSPNLKVYSVPLSYTCWDSKFKTTLTVPYIQRTIKKDVNPTVNGVPTGNLTSRSYKADGLGDLGLTFDYRWLRDERKEFSTDISFTIPSGDVKATSTVDGTTQTVPLGVGSLSLAANQHASYFLTPDKLRVFGTVGVKWHLPTDYEYFDMPPGETTHKSGNLHEERGIILNAMAGAEYYFLKDFSATGRFSVINVFEGKKKFDVTVPAVEPGTLKNAQDDLFAGDFSVTLKYRFWGNTALGVTAIVPAFTTYNSAADKPEGRELKDTAVNINISKYFF